MMIVLSQTIDKSRMLCSASFLVIASSKGEINDMHARNLNQKFGESDLQSRPIILPAADWSDGKTVSSYVLVERR